MKDLKIRHGLGDIDKETFDLTSEHLNTQIKNVSKELDSVIPTIFNLENLISNAIKKLQNISKTWASGDLDKKGRIQKLLFPGGLLYNVKITNI